jgi:hypothetical protein
LWILRLKTVVPQFDLSQDSGAMKADHSALTTIGLIFPPRHQQLRGHGHPISDQRLAETEESHQSLPAQKAARHPARIRQTAVAFKKDCETGEIPSQAPIP